MSKRWFFLVILLLFTLPSALYAVSMGDLSGGTSVRVAGNIYIQTQTVGKVLFNHSIHGTRCNFCHPKIFIKKRNSNHASMKQMENGKSCGACHNGIRAFSVKGDCVTCHAGDIPYQDKIIGKIVFPHSVHVEQFGCDECHPGLYKAQRGANKKATMKDMENSESCGACHDGSDAFSVTGDCVTCHAAGDILYQDKTIGKIVYPHSVHVEQFSCTECHPDLFKALRGASQKATMKDMENGESCGACHDGSDAFSVTGDCVRCHVVKDIIYQDKQIGKITYPHSVHIELFTCYECHPIRFKAKKGMNRATMRDMEKDKSCGGCHDGSTAFNVKGDCVTCHIGAVDIIFKIKDVGEIVFSHTIHVEEFDCIECHPAVFKAERGANKTATMEDMENGKSCGDCHDGAAAFSVAECIHCHTSVVDINFMNKDIGIILFPHTFHVEQFNCNECHPAVFKPKRGANKATMEDMENGKSCGACHDGSGAFGVTGDCITCHTNAVDIPFANKDIGEIIFPHSVHLEQFTCTECHPDVFTAKRGSNPSTMKDMEGGETCGACHDGSTAFSVTGDCITCHTNAVDIPFANKDIDEIIFPHSVHLEQFTCTECHPDVFTAKRGSNPSTMKDMEGGETCGACHDGSTAFSVTGDCITCHTNAVDIPFANKDIGEIIFPHSVHLEQFTCTECHPDVFTAKRGSNPSTMKDMEGGETCGACHDGSTAFSVTGDCTTCHTNAVDIPFANKDIGEIIFPHSVHLEQFTCTECHPDVFTAKRGSNPSTMKDMEGGETCGACHDGSGAFGVTGDCITCHTNAVDIPFANKDIGEIIFPHSVHLEQFTCTECHPDVFTAKRGSNPSTMKDMEGGETCGACHDGSTAFSVTGDCTTCHTNAVDIIFKIKDARQIAFPHSVHVDKLSWLECQPEVLKAESAANRITMQKREKGETCRACHDGAGGFGVAGNCTICHPSVADIDFTFKDIGKTAFPHSVHTEQFSCTECHPGVFKAERGARANKATMLEMDGGKSCGACHDGNIAFSVKDDCVSCHFLCR